MADLSDLQVAQTVKIVGVDALGVETNAVNANSDGRLLVDADLNSGQLVPTITNKFRIRTNLTNVGLNTGTYTTLFTRSGTGLFFGFQVAFNSANVKIRLTIDSGVVFDLSLNDIKQFEFNDTSTTRMQLGGFLTTISNKLDFSSKFAIPYESNVTVDVISTSGTPNNTNWIIFLTEDT